MNEIKVSINRNGLLCQSDRKYLVVSQATILGFQVVLINVKWVLTIGRPLISNTEKMVCKS